MVSNSNNNREIARSKSSLPMPSFISKRRREIIAAPVSNYIGDEEIIPALVQPTFYRDKSLLPKGFLDFELMKRGEHPFIIAPSNRENSTVEISDAMLDLFANIDSADYWEELFLQSKSRSAVLYVVDLNNERYKVDDVFVYPGGDDGELRLTHLGERHQEQIRINIARNVGFMFPVVVLKPYRSSLQNKRLGNEM